MIEHLASLFTSMKKVAPVPLLAICFASALILFCPDTLGKILGVDTFRSTYRGWIGAAFIGSLSYLLAQLIWWLRGLYLERRQKQQHTNLRNKHLGELTPEEKAYLHPYVVGGVTSQAFPMEDGIAGGLLTKMIIFRSSNVGNESGEFPYNIQPWARDYLIEHPELLEGATAPPTPGHERRW